MVRLKLDISTVYGYQDKSETFWKFSFEKIADDEGWWAWIKRPLISEYICIGKISEREIIKRLKDNPPPLTTEDQIDLELWMLKGEGSIFTKGEE